MSLARVHLMESGLDVAGGGGGSGCDGRGDDGVEVGLRAMLGGLIAFGEGIELIRFVNGGLLVGMN